MSATDKTASTFEAGSVAHVTFRVRCEGLRHGEEVFLVEEAEHGPSKTTPLFTTAKRFPWYQTRSQLTLTLPPTRDSEGNDSNGPRSKQHFTYRYAIHRAGVFHRYENPSDGPSELQHAHADWDEKHKKRLVQDDVQVKDGQVNFHDLPLRLLANRESYVVNDVLGITSAPPDIEHKRYQSRPTYGSVGTLHSRDNSQAKLSSSYGNLSAQATSAVGAKGSPSASARRKAVGFAQVPPPYHHKPAQTKQTVHLNSTDGLVVVSAFLPVILHRSDDGEWTADWDYEMLLSMQTHLRVTRVGAVKWRGWHGNYCSDGKAGSPETGVPLAERELVEECLRPFHCVPVWVEPLLFGKMYNGFCKGVLWPVLHNVTSVYSYRQEDVVDQESNEEFIRQQEFEENAQFSEYCMDDVEQGPIHGGRGNEADLWAAYNAVNRQFVEVVVQCFNEGDLVWIHGFHLLILPSYLTRRIPMAKVGIFLHTPFPSSEIFRTLWCREDILRGMLNADQVGFHLFEYARHFLTCCRRLLGLNYGMIPDASGGHTLAIDTHGRQVAVTSIHAGVEPPVLNQILAHNITMEKANSIQNQFQKKHIFCAIDRLESLKGVPLKLLGLERFLHRCPEWVGRIVLIQVGISAFERGSDYVKTKNEVIAMVNKINGTFPGTIQFQECAESEMRLHQRMALLRAADVVMVTPIRDGLNLLPLEFTIAHQDALTPRGKRDGRKRGLCILSEFSSCTRVMRGALHVNPWKISEIANAFYQALYMSEDERMRRVSCASEFVTRVTTQRWALAVMLDLKGVHKSVNPVQYSGAGLGLGYRLLGMDTRFSSLDFSVVAKAYKNSRSRLILVDYGGTIVSNDNLDNLKRFQMVKERSAPSLPTPRMIATIRELCADKRNSVFVVSGKERHSLSGTLGNIPNLGLAAEHGMFISWPTNKTSSKRRWEPLISETDRTWRTLATTIMEVYVSRTHGSYIEETEMKVLWQYRDADLEFGYLQARELEDHLAKYLRSFPVDILHGGMEEGGYVEVRPKGVNKGVLAMRVIRNFQAIGQKERVDFALVLGDDHCDEPMLSVVRQIGRRVAGARMARYGEDPLPEMPATITLVDVSSCDNYVSQDLATFTCTIGKKPSAAANYLRDVEEVQELFDSLVKVSTRDHKFYSSVDLRSFNKDGVDPVTPIDNAFSTGLNLEVETVRTGMIKSMSLGGDMNTRGHDGKTEMKVSSNLNEYLGLTNIADDDEDDEAFFF